LGDVAHWTAPRAPPKCPGRAGCLRWGAGNGAALNTSLSMPKGPCNAALARNHSRRWVEQTCAEHEPEHAGVSAQHSSRKEPLAQALTSRHRSCAAAISMGAPDGNHWLVCATLVVRTAAGGVRSRAQAMVETCEGSIRATLSFDSWTPARRTRPAGGASRLWCR